MVPAEGIEPPTFGLQNRCSTAELSRRCEKLPVFLPVYWGQGKSMSGGSGGPAALFSCFLRERAGDGEMFLFYGK